MSELIVSSAFFGSVLSLAAYFIGVWMKNRFRLAIFNPILIAVLLCIAFLAVTGISYDTYYASARYLGWFLTPATVCLAIPLYEQLSKLKENFAAICVGILSGVLTSLVTVLVIALVFHLTHEQYVTLLPKSVTSPIGMGIAEELGGYPAITVQAGIPVEWTIHADAEKLNGCNNEIVIPAYGLSVALEAGDNLVTFTPEKAGTVPYSCWMGMIHATIEVTP